MKSIKEIEKNRKFYHKFQNRNTTHRSSLTVPQFFFCDVSISFLNHFLIKRSYEEISCKMSSISEKGKIVDSLTYNIDKPKVYEFCLSEIFNSKKKRINHYLVEFYSSKNLFIPFPAVIINHYNNKFFNTVHSYNRVLNDIFEDDKNNISTPESSFECINEKKYDTFFNFCTGPFFFKNNLNLNLISEKKKITKNIKIRQSRLTNKNFYLSKIFKNSNKMQNIFLKVSQPKQDLFFNRLIAGVCTKKLDAFSANHSYYDTFGHKEYFNNQSSSKSYPFFYGFKNKIAFYPILSPCKLKIKIQIKIDKDIKEFAYDFDTKGKKPLILDINEHFEKKYLKKVSSFNVVAESINKGIPKRVNHQLIYGHLENKIPLNCSINVSLNNKEIYQPIGKKGFRWGQVVCGEKFISRLGICKSLHLNNNSNSNIIKINFYDLSGKIKTIKKKVEEFNSLIFDLNKFFKIKDSRKMVWYSIESENSDISAFSFHLNKKTKFSSGEHAF